MLDCARLYNHIEDRGIRFFVGVPDSLLKDFCAYVSDHADAKNHVIAANEGNAVALAIGHFLGSGEPAAVYMQNSGIGNAVNPLLSLADPDVYSIPLLMIIGWRGQPDTKDEPQHVKQGRTMTELLDAMEIPWFLLPQEDDAAENVVDNAIQTMRKHMGPVALLVRAGSFSQYKLRGGSQTELSMNREDAIQLILGELDEQDIVVSTTGKASREVYEYRKSCGKSGIDFLTVGGMGHTASIAMGVARAQPARYVVCLDGDGSTIMHMGALGVIANSAVPNLIHVVLNNGAHDSVGGQRTVGYDIDLPGIASACGYRESVSVTEDRDLKEQISRFRNRQGPTLLEVKVNKGARSDLGRPDSSPIENRDLLMRQIGLRVPGGIDTV